MSNWSGFSHQNYLGVYRQSLSNLFDFEHNDKRQGFPNESLRETQKRYGESTLVEPSKHYGESILGEPPNRYGESTHGEPPKRYGESILGEPPKRYGERILGEPSKHYRESILGEPPKRYRESILGEPLKRYGESILGEPPKRYGESILGEPPKRYKESLLEEPPMLYRGSGLRDSQKLFDRRPNQQRIRPNQGRFDSEPHRNERCSSQESQRHVQGSLTKLFDIPSDNCQQKKPVNIFDQESSSVSQRSDFRNEKPREYSKPQYDDITNYQESHTSRDTEFLPNRFEPLQRRSFGSSCIMRYRGMESSNQTRGQSTYHNWRNQGLIQSRNSSQPRSNFIQSKKSNTMNSFYGSQPNTIKEFNFNDNYQQGKQTFKVENLNKKPHELSVQIKDNQLEEQNVKMEDSLIEHNGVEDEVEWEEEAGDSDEEYEMDACETSIPFTLDSALIKKYTEYPPEPEELGKIFEGLVIYFFYKKKGVKEKNPFVIICESFRRSNKFGSVRVEDGYQKEDKTVKFCTIRLNGMMLVRAAGLSGNLKEPRVRAGVDLINRLAMTCYTLKMKDDYYSIEAMRRHLKMKESPGLFKVVPKGEVGTLDKAVEYMRTFFSEDTDCELIFTNHAYGVLSYAKKNGLDVRKSNKCIAVFKKRTPSYWRDKILASGKMENEKFLLVEPQGIGRKLFPTYNYASVIPKLKNYLQSDPSEPTFNLYGPKGTIPTIVKITVPWEKKNVLEKNRRRKKKRQIHGALRQAMQLNQIAPFRHMNRKVKKRGKKKYWP